MALIILGSFPGEIGIVAEGTNLEDRRIDPQGGDYGFYPKEAYLCKEVDNFYAKVIELVEDEIKCVGEEEFINMTKEVNLWKEFALTVAGVGLNENPVWEEPNYREEEE